MRIYREKGGIRAPGIFELYWRHWGLGIEFQYDRNRDNRWLWMLRAHFLLLSLYLHFPCPLVPKSKREPYMRETQAWGFLTFDRGIHFHWNEAFARWDYPFFTAVHQRHEVRRADGSWVPFVGCWESNKMADRREVFTFPYTYVLKSGVIQERTATVFVERRAWRPKWLTWTGCFEKVRQSIDVHFSDEVGERSGSWKGGCIGCGWEMNPGESPEQTLRRMERERVFA